ncbi:hypothetical protein TNCV_441381 [Trichonephila clavipes]|nr:hypothetical protein TNCV_441381 [Trichonephila clavipes]
MTELNLIELIVRGLETQLQDYVEVRNPTTRAQLIQVLSQLEERYSSREIQVSRMNGSRERRDRDVRLISTEERRQRNWKDAEVVDRPNDRRNNKGTYGNGPWKKKRNQRFESRNRFDRNNSRFNSNNGRCQCRNRGPSEHFIRGNGKEGGRLNSLRVRFDQDDQAQTVTNPLIDFQLYAYLQ